MANIKTPQEIEILKEGGKILASVLNNVAGQVKARMTTKELDIFAIDLIKKAGGKPSFLNYTSRDSRNPYPAGLCVSINDEVVHGIPSDERILKEGDVVSLDLGLEYKGLYTDMAVTVGVGKISDQAQKLINITKEALSVGIKELKQGTTIGDYGCAVQKFVEKNGFFVVKELVGHGVGSSVHEEPDVPNWGDKRDGLILKKGMVLALEPMVCEGDPKVVLDNDGWTWKTKKGLLSGHFEHTVLVEEDMALILTNI